MRGNRRPAPTTLLAVALLLGAGCSDFDPASYLTELRVLAITSDPIDAVGLEELVLEAHLYVPPEERLISETWSYCPLSAGSQGAFACRVPQCEVALWPDPVDGTVRVSPGALALACLAGSATGEGTVLPDSVPDKIQEQVEVVFRYRAETNTGFVREAALRVTLWTTEAPEQRNRQPVVSSVTVDGKELGTDATLPPIEEGEKLALAVTVLEASLDEYVDAAGRDRVEEPIFSFFATAGRFESRHLAGTEVEVEWKANDLEDDEVSADLYVVVRDLRGGQVVLGPYTIPILRTLEED